MQAAPTARRQGSRPPDTAAAAAPAASGSSSSSSSSCDSSENSMLPTSGSGPPPARRKGGAEFQRQRWKCSTSQRMIVIMMPLLQMVPAPGVGDHLAAGEARVRAAAMSERIADSREEAGLPRYSEAAEYHYARREAGAPAEEEAPRDPQAHVGRGPSRRQAQGEVGNVGHGRCCSPSPPENQRLATPQGWWPFLEHSKTPSSLCVPVWSH